MSKIARIPGTPLRDLTSQKRTRGGRERILHLMTQQYKLQISSGTWFAAPGGGRFHDRYVPPMALEQTLEMYGKIEGLNGLASHYDGEFTRAKLPLFRSHAEKTGQHLRGIPLSHFFDKIFEWGAADNPYWRVRDIALDMTVEALKIAEELQKETGDEVLVISWPGMSGFLQPFGFNFHRALGKYEEVMAKAMDTVPGVRVAIEPKPNEPANTNILRSTASAIIAARNIEKRMQNPKNVNLLNDGHALVGLNPEYGHVIMGGESWAAELANIARDGRLFLTHWNSQEDGRFDQDLNVGITRLGDVFSGLLILREFAPMVWCEIDINPEHQPADNAIRRSIQVLRLANERLNSVLQNGDYATLLVKGDEDPYNYRANLDHFYTLLVMGAQDHFTQLDDTELKVPPSNI